MKNEKILSFDQLIKYSKSRIWAASAAGYIILYKLRLLGIDFHIVVFTKFLHENFLSQNLFSRILKSNEMHCFYQKKNASNCPLRN